VSSQLFGFELTDCVFIENYTTGPTAHGGGIFTSGSPTITNCIFENCSSLTGGGICFGGGSNPTLINCTFSDNQALLGAGVGLSLADHVNIVNTIIGFSRQGSAIDGMADTVEFSCCNLFGNAGGDWIGPASGQLGVNGNISEDPLFHDRLNSDFHLLYGSPCRDMGDGSVSGLPENDFEGDPRLAWGGTVDMGADEFFTRLYITGERKPGGDIKGQFVGLPGSAPVGLFIGSDVRETPLTTAYGEFWLLPPRILVPLIPIPAGGILAIPATIPSLPPAPYSVPLQGLIGQSSESLTNLYFLVIRE